MHGLDLMLHGPLVRTFLRYCIPWTLAMLLQSSAAIVDGFFVGRYVGAMSLAALNLVMPMFSLFFGVGAVHFKLHRDFVPEIEGCGPVMPAVFGTPTATYRVAVPRKALQHAGAILMGIEVSVNGTKTCSRNFHGIVERAVFDATAPDAQDQMNVLEQLIDDANKAVKNAVSAAGEAKDAANAARTSVIEYRQLSDDCKAKIAASAAIGVVFATQADIDAQYDTVIAPALSDAETIPPLTQSDIDWALDIINR